MKKIKIAFVSVLTLGLLGIGIFTIVKPENSFSENENRTLQERPSGSLSAIWDSTWQEKFTDFLSDQFPVRDALTAFRSQLKYDLGIRDTNSTYIGKNQYLFEKITENDIDSINFQSNLKSVSDLMESQNDLATQIMLVPSSGNVSPENLPNFAEEYDYEVLQNQVKETLHDCDVVDLLEKFQTEQEQTQLYYRNDHHWTTDGAYLAYQALMQGKGTYEGDFSTVTEEFQGTLYSRTLLKDAKADSVKLAEISDKVQVSIDGKQSEVYHMDALEQKDKYQVFFGGNYGMVDITGGSGTGTLIVLKDSFANSFVPFLTADYNRIIMIDMRYYTGSVKQLIQETQPDQMLVLYEMSNFANDKNLAKLVL